MDTMTSIKVFRQVIDSGGFARAAERLEMSTAMVSKHIMHVEQRLGVRLINRNSRSLSLTEPGRRYFQCCQSILDELRATELELGSLASTPRGTLRVSAPSLACGQWLADLLAEYRRRYPEVLVDLSFEDRFVNLVDEGYDLALRITSDRNSLPGGLITRALRPATLCLAASRDYIRRRGAPKSLDELSQHDFVAVGDMLSLVACPVAGEKPHAPLRVALRYRSMEGVVNAVAAGIGIAPVLAILFDDPAYREILTPVLPDYPLKQATLYAVHASRKLVPPKLRTFVDFIVEFLSAASEPRPRLLQALQPPPSGTADARASNRRPAVAVA